jgi:hypothetical protein
LVLYQTVKEKFIFYRISEYSYAPSLLPPTHRLIRSQRNTLNKDRPRSVVMSILVADLGGGCCGGWLVAQCGFRPSQVGSHNLREVSSL